MAIHSKFHSGELEVQLRFGEQSIAERNAILISDTIITGAKLFLSKQFMVVVSSVDKAGEVWTSILYGQPGFVHAEDNTIVNIDMDINARDMTDPFWTNIQENLNVGMLFIELGSRHRYRINGKIETNDDEGLTIFVQEAYPNCPKYIQKRQLMNMGDCSNNSEQSQGNQITNDISPLIRNADTIFVGSVNDQAGADASHRGGAKGFVQIINSHTLRIPDFNGNSLFNTFGNFEINPNAGICIPDFEGQRILQLTGRAWTLWDQEDSENLTGGTKRFWEFEINKWYLRHIPQQLEWELMSVSPYIPTRNENS